MTAKKLVITKKRCIVCAHPDRALIEGGRVAGISIDVLAAKFKVSRDAIWRHCKAHISDDARADYLAAVPMEELAAKAAAEGVSVLEYFRIIRATLMAQFQLAASLNDRNGVAILAGRLTETLRAIGSISGEMGNMAVSNLTINNTTTIMNSPVFANLQANLLTALAPYPEARAAVVMSLRKMDEESEAPMKTIEHNPIGRVCDPQVVDHVPTAAA
jgi:hypothetical protein